MQIIIQNLNYLTSDNKFIFQDLNLVLGANKIGLVGNNGYWQINFIKINNW